MKCPNCDYIVASKEAAFCPKCGCPMEAEEVVEVVKEPEVVEEKNEVEKEFKLPGKVSIEEKSENSIEKKLNVLIGLGWGLLITAIIHAIAFLDYYSYYKDLFY